MEDSRRKNGKLFAEECKVCGNITAFADDAVYVIANKSSEKNQEKLSEIMEKFEEFMKNNRMMMNASNTLLWEFMVKQKLCKINGESC